jgi:FkbM family methyltransferase
VCLNMIVKDEAHIIRRTLEMLCSKFRFDHWVICDTGSTDSTREIIQDFFSQPHVNIAGELYCDEWVNFAHNRTLALNRARGKTDLLLVFDADDDIHGAVTLPTVVTHDEYHLKFGAPNAGGTSYTRTLLINNRKRFQFRSVVHEYISCLEPSPYEHLRICVLDGDYFVVSGRSGARNRDPDKYLKDALLLEAAHAEALAQGDDLHKRYAFYCANSYRDCGRHADAIRWYKATLAQDNWAQEKYVSCLYMHQCYEALGQKEHGFFYLVKALHYDLERVECLYPLIVHYCCEDRNDVAYGYYRIVQSHYERAVYSSGSKLFLESDKANFFLPYYMIIVADRVGDRACGVRMYEIIFTQKHRSFTAWHLRNLVFNLRFFVGHVKPDALAAFAALANDYLQFTGATFDKPDFDYSQYGIHLPTMKPSPKPVISPNFSRSECRNSKAVLFYTGYSAVPWNHSSMLRGALGGSERAVAYLSNELCRQGYTVYVSGGVQPEEWHGVKYVGLSDLPELLRTTAFHTIVCSRYISFLELYGGIASWHQFYVWAHDTHLIPYGCDLNDTTILEKWSDHIDGCVCQTRWHADEYARQYPMLKSKIHVIHVINNGIDAALFPPPGEKVRNRFIYTSRTERGLSRILDLWPDIIAAVPDATLVISTYVAFPCNDDERRIQARIAQLNNETHDKECIECIRHLGQLNPAQLYAEMGAAEYWLYPTDWPETSCITAMEMLMSGVICLYYPVAGLTDTMGGCGIQIAPGSELETLCKITSDETEQAKQREQGRAYAEGCTWTHRAQKWVQVLALNPSTDQISLQALKKNTMQEYDFGILKSQQSLAPRIQKIADFLRSNHFSVHEIDVHEIDTCDTTHADSELAKCKIVLNANDHDAFGRAGCVRLIEAGFSVVCEPCCELDSHFVQKYPNARVIAYDDFFDVATMVDCYNNPFASKAHNAHVLNVLNKCHREIDFIPAAHVSFLKRLSLEFNPPRKMVVYDIGSSVLHWSNHVTTIWKNSRIYAFDAMTEMKLFYDTYNETKNAELQFEYNVGVLCDEDFKRIAFYQNDDLSGGNSYYKEIGHPNSHNIFTEDHVKHKMGMKLETVVKNRHFPLPDLIKIDVQGAELDILKGSMGIINCAKFLIVELQHTEYNRGAPLCNQTRDFLIENGWKVYAEKFSNNGPDADWCFINEHPTTPTPASGLCVAIFNSFPFHYEMFGYILHYLANLAKRAPCHVSIFTEQGNNWGWLDFYKQYFGERGVIFEYLPLTHFNSVKIRNQYDVIFVTTDDDFGFKREWIDDRCIVIEHMFAARAPGYTHRIGVRPFVDSSKPWALPCYEIVRNPDEKMGWCAHDVHDVHVAVIGGTEKIDTRLFNRIMSAASSQQSQSRVKLHCIGRSWYPGCLRLESACVELVIHGTLSAADMIHCLKMCDYVLTDIVNPDHINGKLMSGCIPLAFSTLTPVIIGRRNNSIYKFKSVMEIDLSSDEPIVLEKLSHERVSAVALERAELLRMAEHEFDRCIECIQGRSSWTRIPKRVMQTWEHKRLNPEFQAIVDTWKTHNPHYQFVLMDAEEREEFIRAHFERAVTRAYQRIVPGAYKSDLFRYCYLWVNGGVYVDVDTLCLGSLDDFLIPGAELVVPIDLNLGANEGTHNLACGFIAAAPRHPAMMRCIQKIVHNVQNAIVPGSKLDFSGPGVLGRAVNECLNRGETASFVGNEGLHAPAKIHFLKFEPGTEFVKNMKNQVLFQNKNGNHRIASLYHAECCKLNEFVSWVHCASPINAQTNAQTNVALMIYGQFRSYAHNLRENVRMLAPIFRDKAVHVFILSNQLASGNYSEQNEREIRDILNEAGFHLCFFDYVENLGSQHAANEQAAHASYFASLKNKDGVSNDVILDIMYRKFALNQIKNAYCNQHNIVMDLHVFGRLFDVIIRHPVHADSDHTKRIEHEIDKLTVCSSDARTVLGSSDTLFIGTREPMDHLFECGMHLRGPEIWNDPEFTEVMMRADSCLCIHRATYSPEVQYIAHMYFSTFKYRNIRFDYNDAESTKNYESLYDIRLDPKRLEIL